MTDATSETERVTRAMNELAQLIRAAPSEVITTIACGDSYESEEGCRKSLAALREVIAELECRLERQPGNHWHPREPIELTSCGVDGQGVEATAIATALLMISDLEADQYGYMDYRWNFTPGRAFFESLPERFRSPLMAGFDIMRDRWSEDD